MAYNKTATKRKISETEDSNALAVELDKKKQVIVRQFNGVSLVDIREFYIDKDTGEKKPGKKGISLTEEVWNKLILQKDEINNALRELNGGKKRKPESASKEASGKSEVKRDDPDGADDEKLSKELQRELEEQE